MPDLNEQLQLDRCPHCSVDNPSLFKIAEFATNDYRNSKGRCWRVYSCRRCGGAVTACSVAWNARILEMYPSSVIVHEAIPEKAREFLKQALNSLHSPAGAVMLAASSVDAMLKAKRYKEGSLYTRIDKAVLENLITKEMGQWAHAVRLDANDQRHADEEAPLPEAPQAKRCVDFTIALGHFLFVLPSQIEQGLTEANKPVNK